MKPTPFVILLLPVLGCAGAPAPTPATAASTTPASACAWARGRVVRLPVLVLHEIGGWHAEYPQTDTPTFALYDDGLVLFVVGEGTDAEVRQARLSAADVDALVASAHAKLEGVPDHISVTRASDQPGVMLHVETRGPTRDVFVYGVGRDAKPSGPAVEPLPKSLADLYRTLLAFRVDDAQPWEPDELAITLFPDDAHKGVSWPKAVPMPPDAPRGRPRPVVYHVDGRLEQDIGRALNELGEVPRVRWKGRTFIIRTRRVVPGGP